ncbi:Clp protease proteolytic subunit, partial [Tanacetum coccineum]
MGDYPVNYRLLQICVFERDEAATGAFILEVGELLKLRETLTRVYVQRTGKPLWAVSEDMERDVFMSATDDAF